MGRLLLLEVVIHLDCIDGRSYYPWRMGRIDSLGVSGGGGCVQALCIRGDAPYKWIPRMTIYNSTNYTHFDRINDQQPSSPRTPVCSSSSPEQENPFPFVPPTQPQPDPQAVVSTGYPANSQRPCPLFELGLGRQYVFWFEPLITREVMMRYAALLSNSNTVCSFIYFLGG